MGWGGEVMQWYDIYFPFEDMSPLTPAATRDRAMKGRAISHELVTPSHPLLSLTARRRENRGESHRKQSTDIQWQCVTSTRVFSMSTGAPGSSRHLMYDKPHSRRPAQPSLQPLPPRAF